MKRKIKLLIADDHAIVRQGLATILGFQPDFAVVGEAEDGQDAVDKARTLHPDIVIMDLMMPVLNGSDATALIRQENPNTKVVILTSYADSADLSHALENGAVGILSKTAPKEDLFDCLHAVTNGETVITDQIRRSLRENDEAVSITPRQFDILQYLSRGLTNEDIAKMLGLSTAGIKFHLLTIFRKLGAANRTEAVSIAQRKHLLKI